MSQMLYVDAVVLFIFATCSFLFSLAVKRNDIADILWGPGCVVIVLTSVLSVETVSSRGYLLAALVLLWGGRLAARIYLKNRGKTEDFRYQKWRQEWGKSFVVRSYLQVFLLQAILMFVVLTPVWYVVGRDQSVSLGILDIFGVTLWLAGFVFEVVADYQLDYFKKGSENKGKILQTGLWKYSRHPNYFGEVLMWWGIYLAALAVPGGVFTVIGPLAITFLILKVSGIPLLEEHYRDNPEFQSYKDRTSVFIPLPPRLEKE